MEPTKPMSYGKTGEFPAPDTALCVMPGGIGIGGAERQMALVLHNLQTASFSIALCVFNQTSEIVPEGIRIYDLEKKAVEHQQPSVKARPSNTRGTTGHSIYEN